MPSLTSLFEGTSSEEFDQLLDAFAGLSVPVRTAESLLERDTAQLMQESRISSERIEALKLQVARMCLPPKLSVGSANFDTAEDLRQYLKTTSDIIPTGFSALDQLLGGGIALHEMTEIIGPSAAGKPRLCMMVSAATAARGHSVIYVDTTNSFSAQRISRIVKSWGWDAKEVQAILSRLRVVYAFDIYDVLSALEELERNLAQSGGSLLVILDSVTAVVSPLLGADRNFTGQALMAHMAASLHRLCAACVGVVVTNQVRPMRRGQMQSMGVSSVPALGRSWTYSPGIRLEIMPPVEMGAQSKLTLLKHPMEQTPRASFLSL